MKGNFHSFTFLFSETSLFIESVRSRVVANVILFFESSFGGLEVWKGFSCY